MKKTTFLFFALFSVLSNYGQGGWTKIDETKTDMLEKVSRNSFPTTFQLFHLNLEEFKQQLLDAPVRGTFAGRSKKLIYMPNEEGVLERFYVMETPIMEDELARKFPMIKSYAAQAVDNPSAVARFSVTQFGLHNMTLTPGKSALFIDPYTEDRVIYIVYAKNAIAHTPQTFECLMDENVFLPSLENQIPAENKVKASDDSKLRTYRLALSCTGEYGAIFDGTGTIQQRKANIQAQMAITMTRVNGVYEKDLAITLIFVANNDLILFFNGATDPWNGEFNTQTAQTIDALIGFSNYDIGHNFNTTGGGNAGCIGCICSSSTNQSGNNHKGRAFTGGINPIGDPFDIDYVAHEMGHQFGGFHTQSSSGCFSGSGLTEVEPGSGSTIMGYAGICPPNVQNNSDAYFHYVNIRDITANIKNGVSSSCAQITNFSNAAPQITAIRDYVIPISTPFVLTATATDTDNDVLNYTWEQNDPEIFNQASTTTPTTFKTSGPVFRSVEGTSNPSRFFPRMSTVLGGQTQNTWEVLPAVSRVLNFAVTVRDNVAGGGQTATDEVKVTVSNLAGPFAITSQNTGLTYVAGSTQTITWNVAATDQAPVNTKFVDIYLSTNNGISFPILLASQVPNDGSELVTIPNLLGSANRIMVKGYDNIFFDVSNASFTISSGIPDFALAFSGIEGAQNKSVCKGETLTFSLPFSTLGGFSNPVTFAVANLPQGITATFAPATATTDVNVVMTLTTTTAVQPQLYTINVQATSGAVTKNVNVYANILNNEFSQITLTTPDNAAAIVTDSGNFSWTASTGATNYQIQIATDANFATIIETATVQTTTYSAAMLENATIYYWRVQPSNEGCSADFSSPYSFSTLFCSFIASTNIPIAIPFQISTVTSTLTIGATDSVTISDLNVQLDISHTYVSDLNVRLTSPSGTQVQLFANRCGSNNNVNALFDDAGIAIVCGQNPAISGTVLPSQALAAFNGQVSQGVWTLTVTDTFNQDGGTINGWGINICSPASTLEIAKSELSRFMVYPNPNNGNFNVQLKNVVSDKLELNVYDTSGRKIFNRNYSTQGEFNENIQLNTIQAGVYLLSIFDGEQTQVQRIIIK
jgi:subtilisin-like proprotein convertase family protein